jgi:uncharacterized protein (DUF1501 family)
MHITRRDFMKCCGAAAGVFSTSTAVPNWIVKSAGALPSATGDGRILVLVQLEGGNDGLNTLVPVENDVYYNARPTLAIPKSKTLFANSLTGFNPELAGLHAMFHEGKVALMQNVGYPNPDFSHFISMDYWGQGDAPGSALQDRRGWLGRLADQSFEPGQSMNPVMMLASGQYRPPSSLVSSLFASPSVLEQTDYKISGSQDEELGVRRSAFDSRRLEDIHRLNRASPISAEIDYIQRLEYAAEATIAIVQSLPADGDAMSYPDTRLGRDLRLCSRLIRSGQNPSALHVHQVGYDTHASQSGAHEELLRELDGALHAFVADMEMAGLLDRVLVLTFSEFGRRVHENGSAGTDHGAASVLFAVGGRVRPGLYGGQPNLSQLQGGNLIHTIDFRNVYSDVLSDWFGVEPQPILQASFERIGFLDNGESSVKFWEAYE